MTTAHAALASLRATCSNVGLLRQSTLRLLVSRRGLTDGEYERAAEETLQRMYSYLDTLPDSYEVPKEYDVSYAMGVLTTVIGKEIGTYVINKQSPNKQIWLSSPISGPKRYDLLDNKWIYSHNGESLHSLLNREFRQIFKSDKIEIP